MIITGLNDNHERGILASLQYAAALLRDCEEVLDASERKDPLSKYTGTLTPPQERITRDYLRRVHEVILASMATLHIVPPPPRIPAVRALTTALTFIDSTVEEMRARYLRGYGEVSPEAEAALDGVVSTLQALVREVETFLTGGPEEALPARVAQLTTDHPFAADIRTLARIVADYGLIDLRTGVMLLVDRILDASLEVAVVGRVSSGKSSLLNALVGVALLPTGVLPVTAFPTRLRRGEPPKLEVTDASGRVLTAPIADVDQFVTEAHNPGNEKRLTRLVVEYPAVHLPERVTFVDTPGLGSLATRGALQTFAYLPRCDHAMYVLDATAPITDDDLTLLAFLVDGGTSTSIVLSKADLLSADELDQVRRYVAAQCLSRLHVPIAIRAVSVLDSHKSLLTAWMEAEIAPLAQEAAHRNRPALARRLTVVLKQALRALQPPARETVAQETISGAAAAVRTTHARLEQVRRDVMALSERRGPLVDAALEAAITVLVNARGSDDTLDAATQDALAGPAQTVAVEIAHTLESLRRGARDAVRLALGEAAPSAEVLDESLSVQRELPAFDLPTLTHDGHPPPWTTMRQTLRRRWLATWTREHWAPTLERAVDAYLDVLKQWARQQINRLDRDFTSQTRSAVEPLGATRPATTRPMDGSRERDLTWLRDAIVSAPADAVPV